MSLESYLLFMLVCLATMVTPGPAMLLAVTNSIKYGFQASVITALGNISCLLALSLISIFGISTVLTGEPVVFQIIKVTGSLYLFYLGAKNWLQPKSKCGLSKTAPRKLKKNTKSKVVMFKEAFCVAASNPFALLFVFALFPQFIEQGKPLSGQFIILTFTLMAFSFSFLILFSYLASKYYSPDKSMKKVYRASGVMFMMAGTMMILSNVTI